MKINLQVPRQLFEKPQSEGSIIINESYANTKVIEPEIIDNIQEAIKVGLEVKLSVIEETTEKSDE